MHRPRPLKRYGQHFLQAGSVIEKIVRIIELGQEDLLLEVGPGRGALTKRLLEIAGSITAVEIDEKLTQLLQERFDANEIRLLNADILQTDFHALLTATGKKHLYVVGNLPYNITAPLLFKLLENVKLINRALLMLQREVAERLVATPGTKAYGILSVLLGMHADINIRIRVNPRAFKPIPKVSSAVVEIEFFQTPRYQIQDIAGLHQLVRACFGQRRKMLRNSLLTMRSACPEIAVEEIVSPTGIDLSRRPETLELEEFVELSNAFSAAGGANASTRC
jgi:16S rRNA (adenine1518-N6/adenine1519-N6)-dimethyltransferase